MRISEIKRRITDEKVLKCVKNDFWEDEYYKIPLVKAKELDDVHSIYGVIKDIFLTLLDNAENVDKNTLNKHKKKVRRLSKLIYGDRSFWAQDTKWLEEIKAKKNSVLQKRMSFQKKYENISFLYERLRLRKKKPKLDIVYLSAKCDVFYDEILRCENTPKQINDLTDLYNRYEQVALNLLSVRMFSYLEYRIMKSVSYLAFKDADSFLDRNNLSLQLVLQNYVEKSNSSITTMREPPFDEMVDELAEFYESAGFEDYYERVLNKMDEPAIRRHYTETFKISATR